MKETQTAVQLVGPGELSLNASKPVHAPGPHGILAQTEAVGLCFSDMKLLKQFDQHVRKSEILSGILVDELKEMPNYVPGSQPTVPGHEVVCRVLSVGEKVEHYRPGERLIVQADYRPLKTSGSNGAFGYNFEGGLQEYILLDERVVGNPDDEAGFMIRVPETRSRSQLALVEPWACVENSYATPERQKLKEGGRAVVVTELDDPTQFADESLDDIVYQGSDAATLETLNDKLAKGGVMNVVLGGRSLTRPVNLGIGRIHYGGTRWVGTTGSDASVGLAIIPPNGEIRPNERMLVIGAGGPMGQMHVIRGLAAGAEVTASDLDLARMSALEAKVGHHPRYRSVASADLGEQTFSYFAIMAPVPALVAEAIRRAEPGAIINVFAGIAAPVKHPFDLNAIIEKRVFIFGTSGSEPSDMRTVLTKVVNDELDTNLSVGAISGMAGAIDGLNAVEARTMNGKIVVYPQLRDLGLIALDDLQTQLPLVAAKLHNGQWTPEAENELMKIA